MGGGASAASTSGAPSDLAGVWVPTRHNEWFNRNPGKHSWRAQMPHTKITYDTSGTGKGWVGEFNVTVTTMSLAPGQWSATAQVPATFWKATDGNLTLLRDGTLEVRYPSNGIVEFWQREDGTVPQIARTQSGGKTKTRSSPGRSIYLVLRKAFGTKAIPYHWGIAIEEHPGSGHHRSHIYEVNGLMAIYGPEGLICTTGPCIGPANGTRLDQFQAIFDLNHGISTKIGKLPKGVAKTMKTHKEIDDFCHQWVQRHPVYNVIGPNCQTFAEDLFTFCTGHNLPYTKSLEALGEKGPEDDKRTQWLK